MQSSSTADVATTDYSVLHRLRGGDGTDESSSSSTTTASPSPEEDVDNSGNNSDVVSVNTSEPVVDISMVETNNEVADDASVDVNADVEEESGQEDDDSLEEVDEHQVGDDDVNNNSIDEIATEETIIITDANEIQSAADEATHDEEGESEGSASEEGVTELNTPDSESESNEYDDSTDEEQITPQSLDIYEIQSNELRTSASDKRTLAKTHHDNGNLKDAAISFREAAMLLDEAMGALSQSSNNSDTKEEEQGGIAIERATCRLHEALCLLKDGRPGECVEACTDVLEDDVTVVPLDNDTENSDGGGDDGDDNDKDTSEQPTPTAVVKIIPATTTLATGAKKTTIPAQIRARAHHRRAKARLALGDLDGALEDARSAAFMGDRNAVQFYGRLMREGSGGELSSQSSPMGAGGSNPFLDGMLGGRMGGNTNTNPFMPSSGAAGSSDFSSSLLSSLLTGSSGSSGGGNPFGLMGELLSPPADESKGGSKRRRGKKKKDSLAKSVLKNVMKRIDDEEIQEKICGYLQSTNKQQIMQFSTMAGVPLKEENAQRLAGLANGITPKGIRKGVRRVKRGLKVVKTGRKILKVIDKYKPVIILAVLLYWIRSAVLEPYPISKKKKKLAQKAAFGLLVMPTQKNALANVRGALIKVFTSPTEADAGSVEDESSTGIEEELEKLQHQITLIEALEERNKAQIESFIDEEDQWNSLEEWEQQLLSSKEALTRRMEQMSEELVLMFMGEKAKNG